MKNKLIGIITLIVLICIPKTYADTPLSPEAATVKCFSRRSDSRHKYLQTVGTMDKTHLEHRDDIHGRFQIAAGYRSSFRPTRIA